MDYTSWLPDWLENWVDNLISGGWSNNLDPEHPDAYLKIFTDSSEDDQIGSTIYRGFYAQGNTRKDWKKKMKAWFLEKRRVIYVNGVVLDKESRNNCTVYQRDYEWVGGKKSSAGKAKLKLPQFDGQFILGFAFEPCSIAYRRSCATGDR